MRLVFRTLLFLLLAAPLHVFARSAMYDEIARIKKNEPRTFYSYMEALSNPLAVVNLELPNYIEIGEEIGAFKNLEYISFSCPWPFKGLPVSFFELRKLKTIKINGDLSSTLLEKIVNFDSLEYFIAPGTILPRAAEKLTRLKVLDIKTFEPGFEIARLPLLESLGMEVYDSTVLNQLTAMHGQVSALKFQLYKIKALTLKQAVEHLETIPGLKSLDLHYMLKDTATAGLFNGPVLFPDLEKLVVEANPLNELIFGQCRKISELHITGISYDYRDNSSSPRLIKPFDLAFGNRHLRVLEVNCSRFSAITIESHLQQLREQDMLEELVLVNIEFDSIAALSMDWLHTLDKLTILEFCYCDMVPINMILNQLTAIMPGMELRIMSSNVHVSKQTKTSNSRIHTLVLFDSNYIDELNTMFPGLRTITTDYEYPDLQRIHSLTAICFISTGEYQYFECLLINSNATFNVVEQHPHWRSDNMPVYPRLNAWKPNETSTANYYFLSDQAKDTLINFVRVDVSWYPSGIKQRMVYRVESYIYEETWYENRIRATQVDKEQSATTNFQPVVRHVMHWNEQGVLVYYEYFSFGEKGQYLFYADGHLRKVKVTQNGKCIEKKTYPPLHACDKAELKHKRKKFPRTP